MGVVADKSTAQVFSGGIPVDGKLLVWAIPAVVEMIDQKKGTPVLTVKCQVPDSNMAQDSGPSSGSSRQAAGDDKGAATGAASAGGASQSDTWDIVLFSSSSFCSTWVVRSIFFLSFLFFLSPTRLMTPRPW